jgi:hypothetical protein
MCVSSSQWNELGADVLLMIFQQLEAEDLVNCEGVCRQWRDILATGTPWRRIFLRNKENLPLWRKAQRMLEWNQLTLLTDQYRDVCKSVLQGTCNWRTGNHTAIAYSSNRPDPFALTIGEDCVAWNTLPLVEWQTNERCVFLDTELMEITEIPLSYSYFIMNGTLVRMHRNNAGRMVNVWNPKFSWTITEEEDDLELRKTLCSASGLILRYFSSLDRGDRVEVWKTGNAPTLLRSRTFEAKRLLHIRQVDDRFIVAESYFIDLTHKNAVTLTFISTETLEVVASLSAMNYECHVPNAFGELDVKNFKCVYDHSLRKMSPFLRT